MNRLVRIFCAFLLSVSPLAVAQNLGTGLYAFGSFDSRGFDSVNIGNLNTHFEIPIVSKPGRGLSFGYTLVYDGLIWSPSTTTGTGNWVADPGWGFHGQLLGSSAYNGYMTNSSLSTPCPRVGSRSITGTFFTNYIYHDPYGKNHLFKYSLKSCPLTDPGNGTATGDGSSSDGSGLTYNLSDFKVHTRNGTIIDTPTYSGPGSPSNGTITDSNGNVITNNGNGTFTDTLGVTALTIAGAGTASSPLTFTYKVANQADGAPTATATLYYATYTVQTNFGCAVTDSGAASVDLADHLTLADGSTYSFAYEPTPGNPGHVTGRLASITLPTGGTINYSYSGGCGQGINPDGTVGTLTRTTSDGIRTYTGATLPSNPNATSTIVQDEKGNQSRYQFSSSNGMFYETHRQIFQGPITGGALLDQYTCYNGTPVGCDGAAITPPFTQTVTVSNYNNDAQLTVQNAYDAAGMMTSSVQMNGSTPLQSIANSYNALEELAGSAMRDSSGNTFAYSYYGYDETATTATSGLPQHGAASGTRGNQTSAHVSTGAVYLTTTTAYYDTGAPISTTTPNGTTQYTYDPTQSFITQTTLPTPSSGVGLATTASYDQQSGAAISATGMNSGQTVQVSQYDRRLRPTLLTLPNGGSITYTYWNALQTGVTQPMGSGAYTDTETLLDAYGRTSRVAVFNGQTGNNWYQVDYCYDASGLLQFQSTRYQATGFIAPKQCSGSGTTYAYDALGRMTSSTNADGTTTTQYWGRAVLTTDVNGVRKLVSHDLLGRISDICEVSSNTLQGESPQACPGDIGGYTGFVTHYAYDLANYKTTITQGSQTRTFTTDAAGRTVSTTEPERGTTTYSYSYNGTGLQVTRTRSQANQSNPNVLTHTVTQYDSLGRPTTVGYDDGITPNKTFYYDMVEIPGLGFNTGSGKGKLIGEVGVTIDIFSYDSMGNITTSVQCLPAFCGHSGTLGADIYQTYSYDLVGNMINDTYWTGGNTGTAVTTQYTVNPAGQITNVSGGQNNSPSAPSIVNATQTGPFGPVTWNLGSGLSGVRAYDSMGRNNGVFICTNNSTAQFCGNNGAVAFYSYADIIGSQVAWRCDTSVSGGCHDFGYDEFGRMTATHSFGVTMFTYDYDRYGNRWNQNAPQGGPAPSVSFDTISNRINSAGYGYDAAGNLTSDGLHIYTYDAEGNILQVDSGATASYVYSGFNRRVEERTNGGAARREIAYNINGQRSAIWDGVAGTMIQAQTYWGGTPVAFYSNGSIHYQHQDWLGTERSRTGYNGAVEGTYTSLPFGDGFAATGSDGDAAHFAMLDHDSESGTEHAQFRQYSSTQGRWMSPDPYDGSYDAANPQSLNRYSYVENSPLGNVDPTGQLLTKACLNDDNPCGGRAGGPVTLVPGSQGFNFGASWDPIYNSGVWITQTVTNPGGDGTTTVSVFVPMTAFNFAPIQIAQNNPPTLPAPSNPGPQKPPSNAAATCMAQAKAAADAQPPVTPTTQNIIDGVGGAAIGLALAPEDAPFLPTLYKAATGFLGGVWRRSVVHVVQQGLIFNATFQGCLAAAGEPMSPTVIQ